MQINLTGHHVDITEPLREYVTTKFAKLERHFDNVVSVHAVLTVEKLEQKAEATIQLRGGTVHADAVATDMYAAIDALTDKLDRQVVKHKEKLTDHHRSEGAIHRALAEE
ncbi:ribosomal subunit interface protein [Alkalilimnicola ehrlichii]|uniref:Ribosome hibernation promoting factor n=1 Tax=Alkalilimnicola ehrlichii TaxID=351052 RepID=A0A3E0WXX9_9GAMM|nr:ribosome hibernation promoting factor [Alkalilimnicola ehrlichii]RFA30285.1 ribosomal subunit interface protein [Alkalilimnicola ehrlichii]RFA37864.1 ribosomal subunit interface protein [Alkalilimnicola ehrlichii]